MKELFQIYNNMQMQTNSVKTENITDILKAIGVGIRPVDDPLFEDTYKNCNIFRCTGITIEDDEEMCHNAIDEFRCNIIGCQQKFKNLLDYEIHYNGSHRYVCQNCKKTLPTPRILDIHIQESHDSYFQVMAEKQPMYQCYESECNIKFLNAEDRKSHCIAAHKFPRKFRYEEHIKHKIKSKDEDKMETDQIVQKDFDTNKGKKSIYINKQKHQKTFSKFKETNIQHTSVGDSNIGCNSSNAPLINNKSALMFLPRQVQQKSFAKVLTKSDKITTKNVLESDSIMDMVGVLPSN